MTLHEGDCLQVMKTMPDNSIDFICTDPPYALTGKSGKGGFMGKEWDSEIPGVNIWKETLRICKPGSMLAAFGAPRTHHHLMFALEEAGWILKDVMMWINGQSFPKGLNIGKHVPLFEGYNTNLKSSYEPIILCMKPLEGTYAQNALKWGVAGMNVDACRIPTQENTGRPKGPDGNCFGHYNKINTETHVLGRYPSNVILDESSAKLLDQHSGNNASRFFYCPKASPSERQGSTHPCMKPLTLMRYLIKLLAPPGNPVCLDPFCGSGTTLLACKELGVDCIGIEREAEYCDIIRKRLSIT